MLVERSAALGIAVPQLPQEVFASQIQSFGQSASPGPLVGRNASPSGMQQGPRGTHHANEVRGQPLVRTNVIGQNDVPFNPVINVINEKDVVHHSVVNKNFEVITEKPVVREIIVEKPYDVIVEKPFENYIEREVIYETYIENPIERVIENEVERIVNVPVERIIEKPVYYEKIIQKPVDNIIQKFVDVVVDQPVQVPRTVNV